MRFEPKTVKKIGFLGVSGSTLRRFGIELYDFDDAQARKIATQVGGQRIATIEKAILFKKNCVSSQKPSKNRFFGVPGSTLRRSGISLCDCDDSQTHRIATPEDVQRVATIKRQLYEEKIVFWAKEL